ncbi:MAG: hypothetical protein GEU98_08545 [Pseudonocardiaceae bacterium]|nr:hypothetical protein [Pseudonocardiaceae bacterium]
MAIAADDAPLTNLLLYVGLVLAQCAVCWAVLYGPRTVRRLARWRVRRRPRPPKGPPIQSLAADLRRVHRTLAQYGPGTPIVRRVGARQAYDALLVQACAAVDVEHHLDTLPEGIDREMERLRVEESLRSAGLAIP